ncbi:MAG: amidohydrolase family protein [Candidatus Bathyarchaeia archaeon]
MDELIVDFHVHPKRRSMLVIDEILREMDEAGISKAVLLGKDTDPLDIERPEIRNKVISRYLGSSLARMTGLDDAENIIEMIEKIRAGLSRSITTNKEIADLVESHPGRFVGLGAINLSKDEEYVRGKLKEVESLELKGLKLHPIAYFFNPADSENLRIVCENFEKNGKILLFHTGCSPGYGEIPEVAVDANPKYLEQIAEEYNVPIVLAHSGFYSAEFPGIWFEEALELGRKHSNVSLEVSAVAFILDNEKLVGKVREAVGMDRVILGSDYLEYMKISVDIVKNSPYLTSDEKKNILGFNAARILKMPLTKEN